MKSNDLRKLILAALFMALTCVATLVIQIPTPTKGYVNLGDCMVNVSAWMLGPIYGTAAAGLGSCLADAISGYFIYAPATLVIKGLMALASCFLFKFLYKKTSSLVGRIISAIVAEIIMCFGYWLFEGIMYQSFLTASTGLFSNAVQGIMGVASSVLLYEAVLKRIPFVKKLNSN